MRSSQLLVNAEWRNTGSIFFACRGPFLYPRLKDKQKASSTWTKYRLVSPLNKTEHANGAFHDVFSGCFLQRVQLLCKSCPHFPLYTLFHTFSGPKLLLHKFCYSKYSYNKRFGSIRKNVKWLLVFVTFLLFVFLYLEKHPHRNTPFLYRFQHVLVNLCFFFFCCFLLLSFWFQLGVQILAFSYGFSNFRF